MIASLTTLALAIPALGMYLHNSYFTVAQLHLLLLGTVLTSFLAGLFHWLPTLINREYSHSLGYLAAAGMLLGSIATFTPLFILGTQGSPKGLHSYPEQFQTLHLLSSIGAIVLVASLILGMAVAVWSWYRGKPSSATLRQDSVGGEFSYVQMATNQVKEVTS